MPAKASTFAGVLFHLPKRQKSNQMKKQTFLTITGVYAVLLSLVLILAPNFIFQAYGFPKIADIPHEILIGTAQDFIFYTGVNSLGIGILALLSIKGIRLKSVFLVGAIVYIGCGLMVIYENATEKAPISAWIDMAIRLSIGFGFLYYYFTEKE
jgi:peptidoglycan/LPS O-acetylase OafA/YrhL